MPRSQPTPSHRDDRLGIPAETCVVNCGTPKREGVEAVLFSERFLAHCMSFPLVFPLVPEDPSAYVESGVRLAEDGYAKFDFSKIRGEWQAK